MSFSRLNQNVKDQDQHYKQIVVATEQRKATDQCRYTQRVLLSIEQTLRSMCGQ